VRIVPIATILGLLIVTGCVPSVASEDSGEGWSEYVPKTSQGPFVPATYHEGGKVVMPVTFLDGSTAELVYDPKLRLAERGVWAMFAASPPDGPGRAFIATQEDLGRWIAGQAPVETFQGADGALVTVWATPDGEPPERLVYEFGPWRVLAPQDGAPADWATGIAGRTTQDGFLVVEGRNGFTIAAPGGAGRPQLIVGDLNPEAILLTPGECDVRRDRPPAEGSQFGSWCLDAGGQTISVHAYSAADGAFGDAVAAGLRIRNYTAARL
jgi:hypothetical protein